VVHAGGRQCDAVARHRVAFHCADHRTFSRCPLKDPSERSSARRGTPWPPCPTLRGQNRAVTHCPCRIFKLEHADGEGRPRLASRVRVLPSGRRAESACPSSAISAYDSHCTTKQPNTHSRFWRVASNGRASVPRLAASRRLRPRAQPLRGSAAPRCRRAASPGVDAMTFGGVRCATACVHPCCR